MSVLIRGMEMPRSCLYCYCVSGCPVVVRKRTEISSEPWIPKDYRHEDCPIGDVPPHGDLIDAHYLKNFFANLYDTGGAQATDKIFDLFGIFKWIDRFTETSTVIEAEGET